MTAHVHAEVIKAWADDTSLVVEFRRNERDDWSETDDPSELAWLDIYQYRIKPQPKAISWTNMYASGGAGWSHRQRESAEKEALERENRVALVEVRDDGTAHLHNVEA